MKSFKKLLAAGLAVTSFITATIPTVSAADILSDGSPLHYTEKWYYSQLTSREKEVYKYVYECASLGKNANIIKYAVNQTELDHVRDAFFNENPQFDIQVKGWSKEAIYVSNDLDKYRALQRADDKIIVQAKKLKTDYERVEYFHDYIINNVKYRTLEQYSYAQSAYGALVGGKASCEGYTDAFMYLCHQMGIECVKVVGEISAPDEWHAWNMVKIEGNWFNMDVCWDDTQDDLLAYNNFLVKDSLFFETHYPELTLATPTAADTYRDYGPSTTTDDGVILPAFRTGTIVQVTTDDLVIAENLFNVNKPSKLKVTTSDSSIAYVNDKGTVRFKKPGKVWVIGEYAGETAKVLFKVYKGDIPLEDDEVNQKPVKDKADGSGKDAPIAVKKPKLVKMDEVITIEKGETVNLASYFNNEVFDDIKFTIYYNRRIKAKVDETYNTLNVTGKKLGTTYLYATYNGIKYRYTIKVIEPTTAVVITRKYVNTTEDIYDMDFDDLTI